eukprot:3939425-Rhodomonas_salina.2
MSFLIASSLRKACAQHKGMSISDTRWWIRNKLQATTFCEQIALQRCLIFVFKVEMSGSTMMEAAAAASSPDVG